MILLNSFNIVINLQKKFSIFLSLLNLRDCRAIDKEIRWKLYPQNSILQTKHIQ